MDIAFTPDGKRAHVALNRWAPCEFDPASVCRAIARSFDPATGKFGAPAPLRRTLVEPGYIALSPDGRFVYAAERRDPYYPTWAILVVDTQTNTIAGEPIRIANSNYGPFLVTGDGKSLIIGGDRIVFADIAARSVASTPIAVQASALALSADGRQLYALSTAYNGTFTDRVHVIDLATRSVVRTFVVPLASDMARSPDGKLLAVANPAAATVIDLASGSVSAPLAFIGTDSPFGGTGRKLAFSPDGARLYMLGQLPNNGSSPTVATLLSIDMRTRSALPLITLPTGAGDTLFIPPGTGTLPPPAPGFPRTPVLDQFDMGYFLESWSGALTGYRRGFSAEGPFVDVQLGGRIYWQPQGFGTSQEAFMTLRKIDPDSRTQGIALKAQGGSASAVPDISFGAIEVRYDALNGSVNLVTYLPRATRATIYPTIAQRFAAGDQLGARVKASGAVEMYRNGKLIGTRTLTSADQAFFNHNGGRIGLRFNTESFDAEVIDFGGGNAP